MPDEYSNYNYVTLGELLYICIYTYVEVNLSKVIKCVNEQQNGLN